MTTASLTAKRLTVSFTKNQPAIQDVSVNLAPGERIAIVGPNGSGKTTLLRALSGRFPSLNAQIFLDGKPLSRLSRQQVAQSIAFVAQHDQADPRLLVHDYVSLGQIPHMGKNDRKTQRLMIDKALSDAGVVEYSERGLGTLSGGQMQRVLLARAFAQTPRILMLDEPTNHLDLRARNEILTLVRDCSASITVTVLHDLSLVRDFADKLFVMHQGHLVAAGAVEETLTEGLLNEVFGMTRFIVKHPVNSKPVWVFDPVFS